MINPQWLELPMSQICFHRPKDVRAIEVLLNMINNQQHKKNVIMPHANSENQDKTARPRPRSLIWVFCVRHYVIKHPKIL